MRLRHPQLSVWLCLVAGVAAVALLLLAPIGLGATRFAHTVENAAHVPLFALVAIGLLLWLRHFNLPLAPRYVAALLVALALGASGEIAQSFTRSRDAEWIDLGNDFLGAVAGLSIYTLYHHRQPLHTALRNALYLVVIAVAVAFLLPIGRTSLMYWQRWHQLPQLVTWDSLAGHRFVTPDSAQLRVTRLPSWISASDEIALAVYPLRTDRWVGVNVAEPWPDWRDYTRLAVEVANPNDAPLKISIRINDRAHNNEFDDRFNRGFDVAPRTRTTLWIPLADVRAAPKSRQLDLQRIAAIILFQDAERGAYPLYVCGIRLVH